MRLTGLLVLVLALGAGTAGAATCPGYAFKNRAATELYVAGYVHAQRVSCFKPDRRRAICAVVRPAGGAVYSVTCATVSGERCVVRRLRA